jgi:Flp pilus assembly pilin Flp
MQIAVFAYTWVLSHMRRENGQDLLEYALLGGLVAAAIVAVLVLFTGALNTMFTNIGNCIDFDSATACSPGF